MPLKFPLRRSLSIIGAIGLWPLPIPTTFSPSLGDSAHAQTIQQTLKDAADLLMRESLREFNRSEWQRAIETFTTAQNFYIGSDAGGEISALSNLGACHR